MERRWERGEEIEESQPRLDLLLVGRFLSR